MPYAANGTISRDWIDGGIEITEEQYAVALAGILEGKVVSVDGGLSVTHPPEPVQPPPTEPTPDEVKVELLWQTQVFMDEKAREAGYDNLLTAISYAEEPTVEKFQNEGKAFRAWRSLVWAYANEQVNLVLSGDRPQPGVEEFLNGLPSLNLPA
ncbi:hypothetical protein [Pseudomonas sp. NFACC37-1]|uniref:hypothetical protein n=1 Tax=Pseudomonas sp. NFACC37-1 TaxID=1566196 RepID=UPI0008864DC1|nr:hypothetical protein [Pseudomonas sp. NFACC37-1]SCZ14514.1 hypothetical protein SAMN03159391_05957 [Pseudomonas sp. NFACC37-1]